MALNTKRPMTTQNPRVSSNENHCTIVGTRGGKMHYHMFYDSIMFGWDFGVAIVYCSLFQE